METCNHHVQESDNRRASKKKILSLLAVGALVAAIFLFFRYSALGTSLLWRMSEGGTLLLPLVIVSSLLDSINPCAFSVLIVTVAFLLSVGTLRAHVFRVGGMYILGIFLVYMLIGLGLLQALHLFDTPHFMSKVGAGLLILLGGINVLGELFPRFPITLKIPDTSHQKMSEFIARASMPAAFALGVLVGLCEFPCTGGPYLMVLGLLYDYATFWSGFGYLLLYNLIFVFPLVIILFAVSDESVLGKVQEWRKKDGHAMRFWSGVAMVVLGILIFLL